MKNQRIFQIIACNRRDGIAAYFFLIDGAIRHSSYDLAGIKAWALGYAGKPVSVTLAPWPTP